MLYPNSLQKAINFFKSMPGIGEKTAERLALSILNFTKEEVEDFSLAVVDTKNNLKPCKICGHLTDKEKCNICDDESRNKNLICILEDSKSVYTFEKVGNYKGTYHVLNGLISPIENTYPDDINLSSLVKRCEELNSCELIIALKSTVEGETTTLYIKKILEGKEVVISRLSYGIPIGAEIDYIDALTLDKALEDRKKIS